ncbi:fumarylacetoacetate hydrolase domain-containing protein 2-like [Uranotaenia lowii]|uniref:fumarylacetoacetate hydrolase domain-containing protein 2-like n=1 Tax=Uranotaenia lowii TaxID=190385 RepID=UPI00247A1F4B|nr:fumarylacetoacetate hydrolase domain-containing protein 2-like [Uranotaenia lowii]
MSFLRGRLLAGLIGSCSGRGLGCKVTSYQVVAADNHQSLTVNCPKRNFSKSSSSNMKFVQFKTKSSDQQRLGVLSSDGSKVTDISDDFSGDLINLIRSGQTLEAVQKKASGGKSLAIGDVNLLAPVTNPQKILCVGLNYRGHCEEQNKPIPKEPMFFSKYASTIVGPFDGVIAHRITDQIDWEVELAVVIGREARHVSRADALNYVFGYTVAQDISARDWQKTRNGGQFLIGKSMDSFCPLGPAVVHRSAIADPHNLNIRCSVNGVQKQNGSTGELVFRIDDIIERVTQSITLLPGDVILTGTPAGVGMHRNPPEFLKPGDVIDSEIESIGKIKNTVVADQ